MNFPRRILVMAATALFATGPTFAETLRNVLQAHGVSLGNAPRANLDREITSYAILDDPKEFVAAYYLKSADELLHPPLFVTRVERSTGRWTTRELKRAQLSIDPVNCVGSAMAIQRDVHLYYVTTHLNPSAGCTLVLDSDLKLRKALYGWFLAATQSGIVVLHKSQRHFAPTHPAEVAIYNPQSGAVTDIYPMRPFGPIRKQYIEQVRRAWSDPEWCRANNHDCDPEQFDNTVVPPVAVNDATDSLAFVVAFEGSPIQRLESVSRVRVVYVYRGLSRGRQLEYRELLLSDVNRQFPGHDLRRLLETRSLKLLFDNN